MRSSTSALNHTSESSNSDDRLVKEIEERLTPYTKEYTDDIDAMATELIKALSVTGEISDKAHSAFLDSLMLSTADLYDNYQEVLTELGAPMSSYELECKKQDMMNAIIDRVNKLIDRVHENDLIFLEQ